MSLWGNNYPHIWLEERKMKIVSIKKLKKKYSQRWIVVGGGGQEAFCSRPIRIEINFFVLHQSGRRSIPKTHNLLSPSHHTPQTHTWSQSQIICPVLWSRYTRTDQVARKVFMISNLFSTIWHWDLWWWGVSRWGGRNWMEWWWMDWGWDPPKMDCFSPSPASYRQTPPQLRMKTCTIVWKLILWNEPTRIWAALYICQRNDKWQINL